MKRCPICSTLTEEIWETVGGINGGSWWTGRYCCDHCGQFRASGTERDGIRRVIQWSPGCPVHGCDPVHLVEYDEHGNDLQWCCAECSSKFEVHGGKLVTVWKPYEPTFLTSEMVDEAMKKIGEQGLA